MKPLIQSRIFIKLQGHNSKIGMIHFSTQGWKFFYAPHPLEIELNDKRLDAGGTQTFIEKVLYLVLPERHGIILYSGEGRT